MYICEGPAGALRCMNAARAKHPCAMTELLCYYLTKTLVRYMPCDTICCLVFDSEESFWSGLNGLRGALEAGGP